MKGKLVNLESQEHRIPRREKVIGKVGDCNDQGRIVAKKERKLLPKQEFHNKEAQMRKKKKT